MHDKFGQKLWLTEVNMLHRHTFWVVAIFTYTELCILELKAKYFNIIIFLGEKSSHAAKLNSWEHLLLYLHFSQSLTTV